MTQRKRCRTSLPERVVSPAGKKPKPNGQVEMRVMGSFCCQKKNVFPSSGGGAFPQLLLRFAELRGLAFPTSLTENAYGFWPACGCRLPLPDEKDIFNELIRWNFPRQSLSGKQTLHGTSETKTHADAPSDSDKTPSSSSRRVWGSEPEGEASPTLRKHLGGGNTRQMQARVLGLSIRTPRNCWGVSQRSKKEEPKE